MICKGESSPGLERLLSTDKSGPVREAVEQIVESVRIDAVTLTFQALCSQFLSDAEQCAENDTGDGALFSKGVTNLLDRAVELAALAELQLKTVETASDSSIDDVVIAINALPQLWSLVLGVLFAELRNPVNAAGLEQTLTLEKLKAGEVETPEGEASWSDEKKARVKASRERNATLTEVARMVFLALSVATRDLLSIAAHHSCQSFCSSEHWAQLKAIAVVCTVLAGNHIVDVNATRAEAVTPPESTKWLLHPALITATAVAESAARDGSGGSDTADLLTDVVDDSFCFHRRDQPPSTDEEEGGPMGGGMERGKEGMKHQAGAQSFLTQSFLCGCCAHKQGHAVWMKAWQAIQCLTSEEEEEEGNAALFVQLAKFEESWGGTGDKNQPLRGVNISTGPRVQGVRCTLALAYHYLLFGQTTAATSSGSGSGRGSGSGSGSGECQNPRASPASASASASSSSSSAAAAAAAAAFSPSSLLLATAGPLCLRLMESPLPPAQLLGVHLLYNLLLLASSGLLLSIRGWIVRIRG